MKILVTGAGGFVGSAVAELASRSGHDVAGLVRPGGRVARLSDVKPSIRLCSVDLNDFAGIDTLLADFQPDAIVHSAWAGLSAHSRSSRSQITDNIEAAINLVDASAKYRVVKFVGIGSQGEYGLHSQQMTELDLPAPTSLYGASKLAVYQLTRQLASQVGMEHAWVRLFSTYGPRDNDHWLIPSLIEQMLDGTRPRTTLGEQQWDFLYIDDVAAAILKIVTTPEANGVFNLGSGQAYKVRSVVEKIRDQIEPSFPLRFGEIPYGPNQIWILKADIGRLLSMTDWKPAVDIDKGLAMTIRWHRSQRIAVEI